VSEREIRSAEEWDWRDDEPETDDGRGVDFTAPGQGPDDGSEIFKESKRDS